MGRAALNWGVRDLAQKAGVAPSTVTRFENGLAEPNRSTLAAMRRALEDGGVRFTERGVEIAEPAHA